MSRGKLVYISPKEHRRLVRLAGERAFVRGYCAATAMVAHEGRQTGAEEMLRAASITVPLMKRCGVDPQDIEPIATILKKMAARSRAKAT